MNKKAKKYIRIAAILCIMPMTAFSQQTEPLKAERLFVEGKQLFFRRDYAAVYQTLIRYQTECTGTMEYRDETDYMLACAVYELRMDNYIETLECYLADHPDTKYSNRIKSLIASAYFFNEDYSKAADHFLQCKLEHLPAKERDACILRLGTSFLKTGNTDAAAFWFNILKESAPEYRNDAIYNLAYIDYTKKKYKKALDGFLETVHEKEYSEPASCYIADIHLATGEYTQARKLAETFLKKDYGQRCALQMSRIAGEAAFGMQDYSSAIRYLEDYCLHSSVPERNAIYKLGMGYFYTGVYSKSMECLEKTTGHEDKMSQNAYLHIGLAGLRLKERNRARMAFERAASMNLDQEIKEQALYNYALCIHETSYSPFAESVTVFERFLNEFPDSPYANDVDGYLTEVYMNTKSYEAALSSIGKISNPGQRILEAKQKLLFRMGTQMFAQADFEKASDCFNQSLRLGQYDTQTKADTHYWKGETEYRLGQYVQAADDFRLYMEFTSDRNTEEYALSLYNMGYVCFKQKQYDKAKTWFQQCVENGRLKDTSVLADAYNRMGDCCFHDRSFDEAEKQYAQAAALNTSLGDYSLFQEAFVKGLRHDYAGKIRTLNRLITDYPQSGYMDNALYEQGRAFVQMDDAENAIKRYKLLLRHYPESTLSRKAANEIGLLYYQHDRYDKSIEAYKKVIADYPGSEEARLAQRDLKSIYIDLNRVDDYLTFISSLPGSFPTDIRERDSLTYVAAERVYLRGNKEEAKTNLKRYLQSFPQGAFSTDASYYLGLIAYEEKDYPEAAVHLDEVLKFSGSKYEFKTLSMRAAIANESREYGKALSLYKRMAGSAVSPEERLQAGTGMLHAAYALKNDNEIISASSALLSQSKLFPEIHNEALYYRAKSYLNLGRNKDAMADLKLIASDTRNVYGAEAKYMVAQMYFNEGRTDDAEKEVLSYIETSTPHAYWLARSFILLADVYTRLGKYIEAEQYLLSLRQNYQADDDIAQMIETRLEKLKSVE